MANRRLTEKKREEMFQAWCDEQRVPYVVQVCAISKGSVVKYRQEDGWDVRLRVIQEKARVKLDNDVAEYIAETLSLIREVKDVYLTSLVGHTNCPHCQAKVQVPKLKPVFGDFDKIIRLEEFIRGKPDARPDVGRMLDQLSDEDLMALWERSTVDVLDGLREIRAMVGKRKAKDVLATIDDLVRRLS